MCVGEVSGRLHWCVRWKIFSSLFIMGPHANHLYSSNVWQNLIHKTMLNINTTRIGSF